LLKAGEDRKALRESIAHREIASALGWRELCRTQVARRETSAATRTAQNALQNLAVIHGMARHRRSKALFRQALSIAPATAETYFEFGKVLDDRDDTRGAVEALTRAVAISGRPAYWSYLASAQANLFKKNPEAITYREAALNSCRRALDDASGSNLETQDRIKSVYVQLGEQKRAEQVGLIGQIRSFVQTQADEQNDAAKYLARLQAALDDPALNPWAGAQIALAMADKLINLAEAAAQDKRAALWRQVQLLTEGAESRLRVDHFEEVRTRGLYRQMANALLSQVSPGESGDLLHKALYYAERAVALSPESSWERFILGDVHSARNDYDRAEAEWNTCFNLDPSNTDALNRIAGAYWSRGADEHDRTEWKKSFRRVTEFFGRVVTSLEAQALDLANIEKQMQVDGYVHFWLGRFHLELMEYTQAISHLKKAKGVGFKPFESTAYQAWLYLEIKSFDEAETSLLEVGQAVRALVRKGGQAHPEDLSKPAPLMGEDMPMNELLARIYLSTALCCAERGARFTMGRGLLRRVRTLLDSIAQAQGATPGIGKKLRGLNAFYWEFCGWIAWKACEVDRAVRELERAAALQASPDRYFRLCCAYVGCAKKETPAAAPWLAKAKRAAEIARDLDLRGRYDDDLDSLEREIKALVESGHDAPTRAEAPAAEP
jgi:tetratricopeptide (TPR) repeat protein